jgi:hypothetical protein
MRHIFSKRDTNQMNSLNKELISFDFKCDFMGFYHHYQGSKLERT